VGLALAWSKEYLTTENTRGTEYSYERQKLETTANRFLYFTLSFSVFSVPSVVRSFFVLDVERTHAARGRCYNEGS
jgi:hypothetical protein